MNCNLNVQGSYPNLTITYITGYKYTTEYNCSNGLKIIYIYGTE